jgi:hypothetical protein
MLGGKASGNGKVADSHQSPKSEKDSSKGSDVRFLFYQSYSGNRRICVDLRGENRVSLDQSEGRALRHRQTFNFLFAGDSDRSATLADSQQEKPGRRGLCNRVTLRDALTPPLLYSILERKQHVSELCSSLDDSRPMNSGLVISGNFL